MEPTPPHWEEPASGIRLLRLYTTDLMPGWPRVVILELTADRFREFERDPLKFDKTYQLYPEQPILCISHCAQPPRAAGMGGPANPSSYVLVTVHTHLSAAVCAACAKETVD